MGRAATETTAVSQGRFMDAISISEFSQKAQRLDDFDPNQCTWVVSDLQSKWEIQERLLQTEMVLEEEAVLRASEFWSRLLFRWTPEWSLISKELFDQWIWSWMKSTDIQWLKSTDSASLLHQHLEVFIPLFLEDPQGELMEEWFQNNPDSVIKWRHVYEVCKKLWEDVRELKLVSPALVPMVLLHEFEEQNLSEVLWPRKIILDLGPRPLGVEKSLFQILAQQGHDIEFLETQVDVSQISLIGDLKRLPTQLGEAKEAVSRVRNLLDQGIAPQDIAILAPDIEAFWPSLSFFLKVEGVPVNKNFVQRLIDDPLVQGWISTLRVQLEKFSSRDLESHFFQNKEQLFFNYDEFRRFFENLKEPDQVHRWSKWKKPKEPPRSRMNLIQFFGWALQFWNQNSSSDSLDRVWKSLSKDFNPQLQLNLEDWFFYLESKLSKTETSVIEGSSEGLHVLSMNSAEWCKAPHVLFLGLNEVELTVRSRILVSSFECRRIKQDLGFELDVRDVSVDEMYLAWLSRYPYKSVSYLTSGVSFSGEEVSPSKHWLKSAFQISMEKVKKVESPEKCRFDEISKQREGESFQNLQIEKYEGFNLSATSVKSYHQCPFIFFAQKALRLVDQPLLDFDLDPLNKGRWVHGVFEEIIKQWGQREWTTEALAEIVETKRVELNIAIGDDRIWPAMNSEIVRLAESFVSMEVELRRDRPLLKTLGSEVSFEFYLNPQTQQLHKERESEQDIKVTGRIDRMDGALSLDSDSQEVVLVDYKLSSGTLKGWRKWLEEGDLQMPLYTLAVEGKFLKSEDTSSSVLNQGSPKVFGAYYLVPRTKDRDRGFFLKGEAVESLAVPPGKRSHSWVDEGAKEDLLNQSLVCLSETAEKIKHAQFDPNPKKRDLCERCQWRNLCRAPHLI